MMLKFLFIACLVASAWSLKLEKCSSNGKVKISHLQVSPDPVKLSAGSMKITVAAALSSVASPKLEAQLTIKKKMGFIWVKAPCTDGVGSCKYDICAELTKANAPYQCPLPAQTINFSDLKIDFPSMSGTVQSLITGDLWAKVEVKENGALIGCEEVTITIKK